MKKIKSLTLVLAIVLVSVTGYFFYLNNKYWKNVKNSQSIKLGMNTEQVLEIMGPPKRTLKSYFADSDSLYFYQPPFMASDGIEIFFKRGRVNRIASYEGS
jgi:outer membrane protein assembly factor BamE (lipoprotein component of BamABCDE complex)